MILSTNTLLWRKSTKAGTYIETAYESYSDFRSQNPKQPSGKDFGKTLLDSKDAPEDDTQSDASKAFLKQMQKSQDLWKTKK